MSDDGRGNGGDDGRDDGDEAPTWTFLTNHGHVMVCLAQQPDVRLVEIAQRVGIGERAAHRIVADLVRAGYVTRTRVGRRNVYAIHPDRPLRHPLESSHRIGAILEPLTLVTGDQSTHSPTTGSR